MNPIEPSLLLDQLRWRYATKAFDPERRIPEELWSKLQDVLILTPSSYGLQPWKFIVITKPELKEDLVEAAYGQRQVADCSHLVVLTAVTHLGEADIDRWIETIHAVQGRPPEALAGYRNMMVSDLVNGPRSENIPAWAKLQCYIALGNFMTSAALLGIDTCPMEGFIPSRVDAILGLEPDALTTAVLCPAGYRSPNDKYATMPKARYAEADLIRRID